MSDELRQETESTQAESNGLAWFVTGAMIGAAIAILYAPRSGKDARQYLADKSKETIGDTGKNFVETSKEMFERGRQLVDDAADLFERGRKLVKG
jgi:gas vesicle protein